jgi:hypothetical protein
MVRGPSLVLLRLDFIGRWAGVKAEAAQLELLK